MSPSDLSVRGRGGDAKLRHGGPFARPGIGQIGRLARTGAGRHGRDALPGYDHRSPAGDDGGTSGGGVGCRPSAADGGIGCGLRWRGGRDAGTIVQVGLIFDGWHAARGAADRHLIEPDTCGGIRGGTVRPATEV